MEFEDSLSQHAYEDNSEQSYNEIREPLGSLEILGDMMEMDSRPVMAEANLLDAESEMLEIHNLGTQTILASTGPPALVSVEQLLLE